MIRHTLLLLLLLLPLTAGAQTPPPTRPLPPCTRYAAPTGTGTTCTRAAPCTVQEGVAPLSGGQVLCLLPGTYRGAAAMLYTPPTLQGSAEAPVWIRAETEGTVVVDGEDVRRPLWLDGQYIHLWGVDAMRGDNTNLRFMGAHLLARRIVTYDTGVDGDAGIQMGGSHNTLEDCVVLGAARKQIPAGASSPGPGNVVRRCFAQWTAHLVTVSNPTNTAEVGYMQNDVTYENNLFTWHTTGRVTDAEGIMQVFATQRSRVLGNILYLPRDAVFATSRLLSAMNDGGSHSQDGDFHPSQDVLIQYNVAVADPQRSDFATLIPFYAIEGGDGGPSGSNNQFRENVGVTGKPNSITGASWNTPVNMQWGRTLAEAIGAGQSVWTASVASPGICQRLHQGQRLPVGLWPFAMQGRLDTATQRWGLPAINVTAEIEQLLGPIPDQCRWDRPPVPPEPEPPQPPTVGALTCVGQVQAVPGRVEMECTPKQVTR